MPVRLVTSRSSCSVLLLVLTVLLAAPPAEAQLPPGAPAPEPPPRMPPFVPPAWGTTALSAQIHAEAALLSSFGGYLVDRSVAERHHEIAREHRIRNYVLWVDSYFEARRLNRLHRLEENPNFLMREKEIQKVKHQMITKLHQHTSKGDVTDTLNWLLKELSGPTLAIQYLPEVESMAGQIDSGLTERDKFHIRLTEAGAGTRGTKLVWSLLDGKPLKTNWPLLLRDPEFEDECRAFEKVRDKVMEEVDALEPGDRLSYQGGEKMLDAVDQLAAALREAYPKERRHESTNTTLKYIAARRYLQSLARQVERATETNDWWLLTGGGKFEGDSVMQLIHHMYQMGAAFESPDPGGQGTYQKLFRDLGTLYVALTGEGDIPEDVPLYGQPTRPQ